MNERDYFGLREITKLHDIKISEFQRCLTLTEPWDSIKIQI